MGDKGRGEPSVHFSAYTQARERTLELRAEEVEEVEEVEALNEGRGEPSAYTRARERTFEQRARREGSVALKVADWITRPRASPGEREDGDVQYCVQVFTGDMRKAGTDSNVYITQFNQNLKR